MKNCPFVFEKHSLRGRRPDNEYGPIKMKSDLIRPRKQSLLYQQALRLNDMNHDVKSISVSPKFAPRKVGEEEANFKQRYFIYVDHTII